ncbi:hypothetical protein KY335_00995 [Candidatus Woesearchaeota archaeon]|nr:hypothetical protein [Candidatus Woesearchaeota archaeon]
MMMKFFMLLIFSMIMLGLVAGMVSGAIESTTSSGDVGGFKSGGGIGDTPSPETQTPGQPVPEFSTIGIAAAGALGALSYFFVRRKKK